MDQSDVFDIWSENYDEDIRLNNSGYPFEGYYDTIRYIQDNVVIEGDGLKILDLGIGTGVLSSSLYHKGATIHGVDSSRKMLEIAREKMPNGMFYKWDISDNVSELLEDVTFQYIITSYVFHHFIDDQKIEIVESLLKRLNNNGKIMIADISFRTEHDLEICKSKYADQWDHDEHYSIADSITPRLEKMGMTVSYSQISICAGVLSLYKY